MGVGKMLINSILFWALLFLIGLVFSILCSVAFRIQWRSLSHKILYSALFSVLWLLVTGALYWHWGSWPELREDWQRRENSVEVAKIMAEHQRNPQQLIRWFNQRLAQHPADSKGWYYLGKLYMEQNQYQNAVQAYQQALHLNARDILYKTAYVEACFFANKRHLNNDTRQLLQTVILDQPNNFVAHNLLGIDAYQQHHYTDAVHHWQRLAKQLSPDDDKAKLLYAMIAKAQQAHRDESH